MQVSNINMANTTSHSAQQRNINNASAVSFEGGLPKLPKASGSKIIKFFKDLKIGETVKRMFNVVKDSKFVQAPLNFLKNVGKAIVNSKVVQAPINFVKKIFTKKTV